MFRDVVLVQWLPTFLHRETGKDLKKCLLAGKDLKEMFKYLQQKIVVNRSDLCNIFVNQSCRCVCGINEGEIRQFCPY